MNEHEQSFLVFLAEPSRRRVQALLERVAKRRPDVLAMLDHDVRLDPRHSRHLAGSASHSEAIGEALLKLGAPALCHVLGGRDIDGREMPLREALHAVVGGGFGAFMSCIPRRLGFFEYEDAGERYLLTRFD